MPDERLKRAKSKTEGSLSTSFRRSKAAKKKATKEEVPGNIRNNDVKEIRMLTAFVLACWHCHWSVRTIHRSANNCLG